jgi:hypothetical protein
VIFAGPGSYNFLQVETLAQRRPARQTPVLIAVIVVSSGFAVAQVPPANAPPVNVATLPNAPLFGDLSSARSGANGAPEYSNAIPQLKQSIEDQSDDQENPAIFRKHLIDGRFWISGQSNFILQAHTPFPLFRAQQLPCLRTGGRFPYLYPLHLCAPAAVYRAGG